MNGIDKRKMLIIKFVLLQVRIRYMKMHAPAHLWRHSSSSSFLYLRILLFLRSLIHAALCRVQQIFSGSTETFAQEDLLKNQFQNLWWLPVNQLFYLVQYFETILCVSPSRNLQTLCDI